MPLTIVREDGRFWTFDGAPSLKLSRTQRVTEHPIEDGSTVTDHLVRQPDRERIPAVVTAHPRETYGHPTGTSRLRGARIFVEGCLGQRLTISHPNIGVLTNRVLAGFSETHTQATKLVFELDIKQIIIATAESVDIPADAPASGASEEMPDERDWAERAKEEMEEVSDDAPADPDDTSSTDTDASTPEEQDKSAAAEAWDAWS